MSLTIKDAAEQLCQKHGFKLPKVENWDGGELLIPLTDERVTPALWVCNTDRQVGDKVYRLFRVYLVTDTCSRAYLLDQP